MENEYLQMYRIIQRHKISDDVIIGDWSFSESWTDLVIERMLKASPWWNITKELRFKTIKKQ